MKSTKNHFWVLFHSAKSISDHFRTRKNFENFQKIWNFYVSTPILLRWKKWSQQKIIFECSFIAQNPFQTILGLWKFFKFFRKKFLKILKFFPSLTPYRKIFSSIENEFIPSSNWGTALGCLNASTPATGSCYMTGGRGVRTTPPVKNFTNEKLIFSQWNQVFCLSFTSQRSTRKIS